MLLGSQWPLTQTVWKEVPIPSERFGRAARVRISESTPGLLIGLPLIAVALGAVFDTPKWLCYFADMILRMTKFSRSAKESFAFGAKLSLLIAMAGCGGNSSSRSAQPSQNATAAEAYKSKIEVSKVGLAKGENYLGSEVFYVEGSLRNTGTRIVQRVEITFLFKDSLKQVVLKESRKALEYKGGRGLDADKSTRFQVAFDHLPKDWNYVLPDLEVSQVTLKD